MNFKIITILSFICLFLGSCAVNKEYDKALQSNSIRAYQEYQQKFPKSKHKYDVQTRLDNLLEEETWKNSYATFSIYSFTYYIAKYPNGPHVPEARMYLSLIDYTNKMKAAWKSAEFENTVSGYNTFIQKYPDSDFAKAASSRIAEIQERTAWNNALEKNTASSYRDYLNNFPNGANIWTAQSKIKSSEDAKYKPLWDAAVKKNTIQSYKDFCANNPNSSFVEEAWNKIAQIENDDWEKATKKNTIQAYKDFIKTHPNNINVAEAEKRIIDLEVDQIMNGVHGELPPLSKSEHSTYSSTNEVHIFNNTEYTLTIRYSGPESKKIVISPYKHDNTTLKSGDYRITASVSATNVTNYAGSEYLSGGEYDSEYYIKTETYRTYQPYKY